MHAGSAVRSAAAPRQAGGRTNSGNDNPLVDFEFTARCSTSEDGDMSVEAGYGATLKGLFSGGSTKQKIRV